MQQELERLSQCVAQHHRKTHSHTERLSVLEGANQSAELVKKIFEEQIKDFKVLFLSEFKYWRQKN
jgi:hypothetical protein